MKRICTGLLVLCLLLTMLPMAQAANFVLEIPVEGSVRVQSQGRYQNWAGRSTVSQFQDREGNFCYAVDEGDQVTVYWTQYGRVITHVSIANPYELFGAAACDSVGNLYMVWGDTNEGSDTSVPTIYVCKYASDGTLLDSVSGNGSESLQSYYNDSFYTQIPFDGGNCDIALQGETLVVNYARKMYSGHQSNSVFVVNTRTMEVEPGITSYNSHSFDQRVTPYRKTGGFLLESQGDCFPRGFVTALTDTDATQNEMLTFNFYVQEGAYDRYNMTDLNNTRARLGNILEVDGGAALIGASVRSLSEAAESESKDVFIQIFDPAGSADSEESFLTQGTRSGLAGNNGNTPVTDYGVQWLTNLSGSQTCDVVQAVSVGSDRIAVLYELYTGARYDSTWYLLLDHSGQVVQGPESIGDVRLNADEDPVYAQGCIQWIGNGDGDDLVLYGIYIGPDSENAYLQWQMSAGRTVIFTEPDLDTDVSLPVDVPEDAYYAPAVLWALSKGITNGTGDGNFSPEATCTRAQVVTFLWRAMGEPEPHSATQTFTDVPAGSWFDKPVRWAVEQQITTGVSPTQFDPEATCSTAHILTFLYRSIHTGADGWYAIAGDWADSEGLLYGTDTAVSPDIPCPRSLVVWFLYRELSQA